MILSPLLFLLAAGVAFIAVGVWMVGRGRRGSAAAAEFVRNAVVTEAEVTDLRLKYDRRMADREGAFFPVVRFSLPDGRVVEAETVVGAQPAPTRVGRREQVRYDAQDPRRVVLAQGGAQAGSVGCARTALGIGIIGVGLFFCLFWALLALVIKVPV